MKVGDDFFRVWGGISGCQSLLNVLLDEGYHERGLPLERVAAHGRGTWRTVSGSPGRSPRVGYDADLALVDLDSSFTCDPRTSSTATR